MVKARIVQRQNDASTDSDESQRSFTNVTINVITQNNFKIKEKKNYNLGIMFESWQGQS